MMVKIEPLAGNKPPGYHVSNWPLLGTKTLRVNLRPDKEEIFNSFKKDCRYILRKFKIQDSRFNVNDFGKFYEIWKKSAKRKHLWIPPERDYRSLVQAFGKNIFCLTVKDMAGAVVLIHKNTAFYYYAGSTSEGTKMNLPYLVVWEAIKKAKKVGCKIWDFEGINDPRLN
jgi:lipid II:glycine glycyltransferase (peptidoglycan interpeptide bridge formation enzyme)